MGVWIMAGVTFREAARKKMLWMALAAGAGFLILFGTGLHFQTKALAKENMSPLLRREIAFSMLTMGLYAVDLLAVLMTILTAVDTLSGEIASGAIQAVATKPVPRWQVLVGKWLGFLGMLTAYIAIMAGGVNAVTYVIDGKRSAALSHLCICHLLFDADQRSARPRAPRTRVSWRLDRTIWFHHADAQRRECGCDRQPAHAQRGPLAPSRL